MKMKTVYYLLLGLCLATAACKPDEPEVPKPEESKDEIISGTCGENLTWSYNKTKAILTISGTGKMENYDYIDVPWKPYRKEIQTVVIGDSVTSIGNEAFYMSYSAITHVTIGNTVTSIGNNAFSYCSALTQVTIPNSVTSIGNSAFSGCRALTQVDIPNNVTNIGKTAFRACRALTAIHVDAANSAYCSENGVLFNKDKTTLIQYPAGKPETAYTIPDGVTSFGDYAFAYCDALTQVTIPNGVTSIGYYVFGYCSALTLVNIPNSVTSIVTAAFQECRALTQVNIPDGVTSIGSGAFENCDALTQVTIPNSVKSIGNSAFASCDALTALHVDAANTAYCSENGILFNKDKTTLIQYPAGKPETAYTIPNGVASIGSGAFENCSALTQVTIPSSVKSIGSYAFWNCSALTEMTVLPTVPPTVGSYAFGGGSHDIPVYVPAESLEAYKAVKGWKEFTNLQAIP